MHVPRMHVYRMHLLLSRDQRERLLRVSITSLRERETNEPWTHGN